MTWTPCSYEHTGRARVSPRGGGKEGGNDSCFERILMYR